MGLLLSSLSALDFLNLTSPNLQLDVQGRALGHDYLEGDMDNLVEILPCTEQSTSLSLGFTKICLHADDRGSVIEKKWSALQADRFRGMKVTIVDLHVFFEGHKSRSKLLFCMILGFLQVQIGPGCSL